MNKTTKNILIFIGLMILFLFNSLFYLVPMKLLNIDYNLLTKKAEILLQLYSYMVMLTIIYYIYQDYYKEKFKDFIKNSHEYFDVGFKSWFIGFILMFLINSFLIKMNLNSSNENGIQNLITNFPFISFILTTIMAPLVEETIFRKSLKDIFNNKIVYIIMSGLIFGYLHVSGSSNYLEYLYILSYGALGSSFAYIVFKTDNIFPAILMHMIHNGSLTIISIMINLLVII